MSRPLWVTQARAWPVASVAAVLPGLESVRGWTWPCGACGARTRHVSRGDRRGALGLARDGRGWKCHQCELHGDVVDFIAVHGVGKVLRECDADDRGHVRDIAVKMGLCDGRASAMERPPLRARVRPPPPPPVWPGADPREVADVLDAGTFPMREVDDFTEARGWGRVAHLLGRIGARVLPEPGWSGWEELEADHEGRAWWTGGRARTWRLAQPMVDIAGRGVGFQARCLGRAPVVDGKELPKALGHRMQRRGWFASPSAVKSMQAGAALERVLVVEGITDFWASAVLMMQAPQAERMPIIGGVSGSFEEPPAVKPGGLVYVATDADAAGDRYAAKVRAALPGAKVLRIRMEVDDG